MENLLGMCLYCVELDLVGEIPNANRVKLDGWIHIQALDYELFSFKCKSYQKFDNFSLECSKNPKKTDLDHPFWIEVEEESRRPSKIPQESK
jgi:hypothetical protein